MEINPNWRNTEIESIIRNNKLYVMMSPGGWWFETPYGKHKCIDENTPDETLLYLLILWLSDLECEDKGE